MCIRSASTENANGIRRVEHHVDVCVVGGGMAGIVAALAAARRGANVLLMHERPVLGGNASSEIRVHICGADRNGHISNLRETGILEELRLENLCRNPNENYSVWDMLLYEKVFFQSGLELLLNCTCQDARLADGRVASVTGWQLTTETHHEVFAKLFVDCSGDGILAPLTGAEFRMGREGRDEYGESISPEKADNRTMGMTCLIQTREYSTPQPFAPPPWAYTFTRDEELPYGSDQHTWWGMGYWWVELGGEHHSIYDTEQCRDELLKIAMGVWDHIKNHGDHGADNWAIEWVQFLPGKRESRRYIGDHVLTQGDVESEGRFDDRVAYGGWEMDDHDPAGFWAVRSQKPATIFHRAPSPYGISYRCLYSRNIENLMFAGRCASATHAAMSSVRVMGTCCSMGQAVGVAAAMAVEKGLSPRQLGQQHIRTLQQALLAEDCYIPWLTQEFSSAVMQAELSASRGDPSLLLDGVNRPVEEENHGWSCSAGDWAQYIFSQPTHIERVTLVLDSMLDRLITLSYHGDYARLRCVPPRLAKAFTLQGLSAGRWETLHEIRDNHQRLVHLDVGRTLEGVRFVLNDLWGAEAGNVFAFYVE